ncbi:MAG: enoyl-CoA hydratase/isomerase family protein, partial [Pseudomonadota bacterium]
YYVPSEKLEALKAELSATPEKVESILAGVSIVPPPAKIVEQLPAIDRLFASDDYEEILAALEADGSDWATRQRETLRSKSPTACKVSLRMLVESPRQPHFVDEMRMEFGIAARMFRHPDFGEGVRALLIDKDNNPTWNPATPEGVTAAMVDGFFQPLPASQAWTPLPANADGD